MEFFFLLRMLAFWTGGAKQLGLDLWTGATPLLLQLLESYLRARRKQRARRGPIDLAHVCCVGAVCFLA